jgi:hypothetical protein
VCRRRLWESKFWKGGGTGWQLTRSYEFAEFNKTIIENPSKTPVMISYWELLWIKRHHFKREMTDVRFPADKGYCNITIPARGPHGLRFGESEYFEWGASAISKGELYLKLHVVGRHKVLTLKIYDPRRARHLKSHRGFWGRRRS